ncbi:Rv3235 family protein [Kitasatospora purpeofusca]|uniref:Rv3235 family protein n=1 Tax=Kitasatospora purpeofusca TaxID=67352 RepID=UPI002E0D36EF|nr:Rv3235 family protein [Kitasatospora purpeofusca]
MTACPNRAAPPLAPPAVLSARPYRPRGTARDHRAAAEPRRPRHPRTACADGPTPDPQGGLSTRFAHRLVEVLTGSRPSGQLLRHTTLDCYGQLSALVRAGTLRGTRGGERPRLGPVHDRSPAPGAVEACVRVDLGGRHHMVAFRLEPRGPSGQWQCTAVEAR